MQLRTVLMLALLATAAPACTVHVIEPGAVSADGSVYLGFDLFDSKGKPDREKIVIGQQHGAFSSIRLVADKTVTVNRVVVTFADGERFAPKIGKRLGGGQSTHLIALPRGPRAIYSVSIEAKSEGKHMASIEVYGTR